MRADAEASQQAAAQHLWCRACGKLVMLRGGTAVHAAKGDRAAELDGHVAEPVSEEPPLWAAARRIAADYGGAFTVTARFGLLRADWSKATTEQGGAVAHYEADDEAGMRRQLDEAVAGTRWARERSA